MSNKTIWRVVAFVFLAFLVSFMYCNESKYKTQLNARDNEIHQREIRIAKLNQKRDSLVKQIAFKDFRIEQLAKDTARIRTKYVYIEKQTRALDATASINYLEQRLNTTLFTVVEHNDTSAIVQLPQVRDLNATFVRLDYCTENSDSLKSMIVEYRQKSFLQTQENQTLDSANVELTTISGLKTEEIKSLKKEIRHVKTKSKITVGLVVLIFAGLLIAK